MLSNSRVPLRAPTPADGSSGGDEGFWAKASHASIDKREKSSRAANTPPARPKKRLKRILLWGGGSLLLLIIILVVAAPSIAGALAPGMVASRSGSYMSGRATLQSASFAWGGPQQLRGLKIIDTADREVASVRALSVDAGLVGLISGGLDLGVITVTGLRADVVREADGTTNLQRLAPAPASSPAKPAAAPSLPANLRASLVVEDASASFTDHNAQGTNGAPLSIEIDEIDINAALAAGRPITLQASARARDAAQPARAGGRTGSITIDATINDLFAKDGGLTFDLIDADIKADIKTFPLAVVDALLGSLLQGGSLREGLGDTADINITAVGGLAKGTALITAHTEHASLRAPLRIADNTLTAQSPLEFTLKGSAAPALSPAVKTMMAGGDSGATITRLPDISATVEQLRIPMPRPGAALDLRTGSAVLALSLGETTGGVILQQGTSPSPFSIAPMTVRLDATDLSAPARLTAQTSATLAGQAAGNLDVDLTIGGLLTAAGAPSTRPASVRGRIALSGVATAIAQPFLQGTGINLQQQVGPSLDASVVLAGELSDPAARIPPTDLDVRVVSEHLSIDGELRVTTQGITTRPRGLTIDSARFPSIVGRLVKPEVGYAIWPSKPVVKGLSLVLNNLDAAWEGETFGIDLTRVSADADISLEGMAIRPIIGPNEYAPALDIERMTIKAKVAKGGGFDADIDSNIWHEAKPFTVKGRIGATDLLARDANGAVGLSLATMKPSGRLELTNVPVSIVKMAPPAPPTPPPTDGTPAPTPLDLPALLAGVVGPRISAVLSAQTQTQTAAATENAYDIDLRLTADRLTATSTLRGSASAIDIRAFEADTTITPESITSLVNAFAPAVEGLPRLAAPGRLTMKLDPISIPLTADGKPDLSRAGVAALAINVPARILVTGLKVKDADGAERDLGEVGVENFQITARAPLAALAGPTLPAQRAASLTAKGSLLAAGGQPLGLLDCTINADLSDKALAGPLAANISITQVDVDALERLAGQPGKLSGAVGTPANARIDATVTPPAGHAPGAPFDVQQSTIGVRATLDAPRFKTDGPLAATITPDLIRLDQPSRMTLSVDPAWANAMLAPAPAAPGAAPPAPAATVTQIAPIAIALERFSWPRAGGRAPLEAGATISLPSLTLTSADGLPIRMNSTSFNVTTAQPTPAGTTLNFRADIAEVVVAQQPPVRTMSVRGEVGGLIDPDGAFNPAAAHLSARGDLPQIPTVLLDVFTKGDGLIPDALGDVAQVQFDVERYPLGAGPPPAGLAPPKVEATARSPRANASLRGTVRDGMFVGQEPLRASLTEVTQALSKRLVTGLPMIGTLEKSPQDQAATLVATDLTVPLSNDMSKLNGAIVIDPGEARFDTGTVFSEVLKFIKQKETGLVGQRLEPLTVNIRSGVATYERWSVPMGQFNIASEGTVNLVDRTIDVVTYVPFGALSDRALGQLNLGVGSAISRILPGAVEALTEVPFRTKGALDKPSTGVDAEMFARNLTRSISPERVIRDNLGDLIKRNLPPPK